MLTRLLVNRLLVNIAYMKIWVQLTFVLVHLKLGGPVQNISREPWLVHSKSLLEGVNENEWVNSDT